MIVTNIISHRLHKNKTIVSTYSLYTQNVGLGTLCIWKFDTFERIAHSFSTERQIHKKVRKDAEKRGNSWIGIPINQIKS